MYKKFLNGFLAVALVVAGTMFTSCQDYDSDIKDLRNQISQTTTDLTSLINEKISAVENEISNLQSQLTALDAAYQAADKQLREDLEKAIEDAKADVLDEAKAYADLQADQARLAAIAAAEEMINEAVAKLQEQLDKVNETLEDQAASIAKLIAADAELQTAIDEAAALAQKALEQAELAYNLALQNQSDIADLQSVVSSLSESVTNLESQVSILNDKVEEALQQAAANAAAILALETELNELKESNEAAHEALQGQIDDLADLIAENQAAVEAALEDLETELKAAIADALAEAEAYVDDAIADLVEELEGKFEDIDTDIQTLYELANSIQTDLDDLTTTVDALTARVAALEAALADINQFFVLGDRLTSLVFAPTTYVDGIASICFSYVTFTYNPWTIDDTTGEPTQSSTEASIDVADEGHAVEYLYSPSHVAEASVASLSFVSNTATNISTKAVSDESPLTISDYSFANGVLSVVVALTGELPTAEDTFTTVALKAEIADDYKLDSEAEQDIFVFSDWARVYNAVADNVTPYIHNVSMTDEDAVDGDATHFWDYETVFTTGTETTPATYEEVAVFCVDSVAYTGTIDLNKFVTVCDKEGNIYDVSEYPFAFEFALVDFYCGDDNQADYATIDGNGVISAYGTMEDYRDAVDKYPVVRVVLKDTEDDAIVDVKYFAIKWTGEALEDIEIDLDAVYLHYRKIWGNGVAIPGVDQAISEFPDEKFEALVEEIGLSSVDEFWTYYTYEFVYDVEVYQEDGELLDMGPYTASESVNDVWTYHHGAGFKVNKAYDSTEEDNDPLVTFGVYFPMIKTQHTYFSGTFAFPEVTCYDADGNETATYPEGDYDAAKYVLYVIFKSANTSICPDIVITQVVYDTDDCEDFTLSPLYKIADPSVKYGLEPDDPAVLCKGQLVNGAWTMYTNVEEHFEGGSIFAQVDEGVDNVTGLVFDWAQAYETAEGDSMVDPEYNDGVGGVIVEGSSNVGLQASLAEEYYVTNMVYSQVLANGEYCPHDYYIVFENPFVDGEGLATVELEDGVGENTAEAYEQVVIYDTYGELVLSWDADEENDGENAGFVISDYAANLYGLDADDVTITYAADEENGDWTYLQEQIAHLDNVILAVDEETGVVTWQNEGTRLQGEYTIYVVATVDFGVATATCTVTVILNPTGVAPATLPLNVL